MKDLINKLTKFNNNVSFKDVLRDRPDGTGDRKILTTKTASKVDIIMRYTTKYDATNIDSIVKAIIDIGYTEELNEIRSLMLVNNFAAIRNQAMLELDIVNRINRGNYVCKSVEECPTVDNNLTIDSFYLQRMV